MMPRIERDVLEGVVAGSFEDLSDTVGRLAAAEIDEGFEIVATHRGYALGVSGGKVVRVEWDIKDGEVQVTGVGDSDVPVVNEENADKHVSDKLHSVVRALCSEEFEPGSVRNQLHLIASLVKKGGEYWAEDLIEEAEEVLSRETGWLSEYEENIKAVRSSLHGVLGSTENSVPKTRYHRVKRASLESFRPEIYDSMKIICEALDQMNGTLASLVFDKVESCGVSLNGARDAISEEASSLLASTKKILELARPEELVSLAKYHDDLAERSRSMLVVSRFLSRASEPSKIGE
jgi:hypothetical protein